MAQQLCRWTNWDVAAAGDVADREEGVSRRQIGPVGVVLLPAANVVAWLLLPPSGLGRSDDARQVIGEMIGSTAVILFAIALLLATRARFLEPYFGGLDKMYRAHKQASVTGFLVLLLHVAVIPWRFESAGGVPAGLIAFTGLTILVLLSIGPRLPVARRIIRVGYRTWRRTHRLIGLFFIFALAHTLLVGPLVVDTVVPFALLMLAFGVGIASYLYVLLLARLVRPIRAYEVAESNRLNDTTLEVVMRPLKKPVSHHAGQFVFVRFKGRTLREPHPFTVASSPRRDELRLAIKAAGDFTTHVYEHLTPGTTAKIEGSYGMLEYRTGGPEQIWIAGGIGITPFLAWLRDLDTLDHRRVDFFYTVRHADEALFADEIRTIAARHPSLRLHLNVSSELGSLTVERLAAEIEGPLRHRHVYMCGPTAMLKAFERDLQDHGVARDAIHYEEFSFR